MKRFFRNLNWKNILIISLALVLGIGAIAGVSSIVKNEKTTLSSLEFKRGALNDLGFYIESDTSIYTKDLIECQGLEIEPDFETLGEYQVYYYDSNKQFMGMTDKINSQTNGVYVKGDTYAFAKYCRIVITPEVPKDEDGHVIDDYKIKFYEVAGIAAKYKISVDKEQEFSLTKILKNSSVEVNILGEGVWDRGNKEFLAQESNMYGFDIIDNSGASFVVMKVATSTLSNVVTYNDGQTFRFPLIYGGDDFALLAVGDRANNIVNYRIIESNADYTFIYYDLSAYSSFAGIVDVNSADILEIYLVK